MSIVTGLTAARMLAIEAASVISGAISGDNLILTKHDGSTINAGNVRGPKGDTGLGFNNFSGRNRIINGDFSVNQRSFTSTTIDGTYGFDRWCVGCSGGTVTYSSQTAAENIIKSEALAFARIVSASQSASTDYAALMQKIENVRVFANKTVTVSFWAKAASGTPKVAVNLYQDTGTGGSGSVANYIGSVTLSTVWTRYSVTGTVSSMSGKTVGTSSALTLYLFTSAGSNYNSWTNTLGYQNAAIDFWGVQVEEGSVLTTFEQKPYADTLRECQRYYYTKPIYFGPTSRLVNGVTTYGPMLPHPVRMRKTPTMSFYSAYNYGGESGKLGTWDASGNITTFAIADSYSDEYVAPLCSTYAERVLIQGSWKASAEL